MTPYSFRGLDDLSELKTGTSENFSLFFVLSIAALCVAIPTLIIKFVDCLTFLWKWGHNAFDLAFDAWLDFDAWER